MDVREESTKEMPYKTDAAGNLVTEEVNGKKLPVFVDGAGKEAPHDADATVSAIARLNGEAKDNRVAKEEAEKQLKAFTDAGVKDPKAAAAALLVVSNIDSKKLVDAGEIEVVRAEISKGFQTTIDDLTGKLSAAEKTLVGEKIGGAFTRSQFIVDKLGIPADLVESRFGKNFALVDGKIVATDNAGNKIYSRTKHGEPAEFDEALSILVDAYPHKDSILKGTGASGGGAGNGKPGAGGGKTITRAAFQALGPVEQRTALGEGRVVVDA